jgi:hypothetical protein
VNDASVVIAPAAPPQQPLQRISERAFMQAVMDYARLLGWRVYHVHDSRRSEPGFPDLCLVGHGRVIFAELKTERGRLTDAQRDWLRELEEAGVAAFVWKPSSWAHIEAVLATQPAAPEGTGA